MPELRRSKLNQFSRLRLRLTQLSSTAKLLSKQLAIFPVQAGSPKEEGREVLTPLRAQSNNPENQPARKVSSMKSYMLLDRSGSMSAHWAETIGALNAYVGGLAADKATEKAKVTIAAFDNQEPFNVIRRRVKASDWKKISDGEVLPRGTTPLFDAIGELVKLIRADAPNKATIVIITDGDENASREIRKESAKALLDEMRAKGFDVVFIGADFDAFCQSADLGNMKGATLNMSAGSYEAAMLGLAERASAYAETGSVQEFTDQDRRKASGKG